MPGPRAACVVLLAALACGSRTPEGARPAATPPPDGGDGAEAGGGAHADAGEPSLWDAGVEFEDEGGSAAFADAGLADIGVAPCEAVVARFLLCPGVPEASKKQMAAASRRWREAAQRSAEERETLAATCLEMARMTEEMLLKLGC